MPDRAMKASDLLEMLKTSSDIGYTYREDAEVTVQLMDEDGNLYYIQDVKYHVVAGSVVIEFSHDDDPDSYEPED